MTPEQEKIIERVKALLAKTGENGASDAEAQTAMDIALKIMDKHHLSESDLVHEPADDYVKVDQLEFKDIRSFVGKQIFAWEGYLSSFVAKFVGVPAYMDRNAKLVRKNGFVEFDKDDNPKYGASIVFYGVAEDAMLAKELYDELRVLIATMAVGKWGTVYRGEGASYAQGFTYGLHSKLEKAKIEEKKTVDTAALILVHRRDDLVKYKEDKAKKWLTKEKGIKLGSGGRLAGSNASAKARAEGFTDGRNTDVTAVRRKKIGI